MVLTALAPWAFSASTSFLAFAQAFLKDLLGGYAFARLAVDTGGGGGGTGLPFESTPLAMAVFRRYAGVASIYQNQETRRPRALVHTGWNGHRVQSR